MKPLFCLLLLSMSGTVMGTHLLGGYISYKLTSGMQIEITINLLTEAESIAPGSGILDFGDGNTIEGLTNPTVVPLAFDVNLVSYTVAHAYSSPGKYNISYTEQNYSNGINNMESSVEIPFYIATNLLIDPAIEVNNSPVLKLFQAQRGASGKMQKINPAPVDSDGDSLSFSLIVPGKDGDAKISTYVSPNDKAFYQDYSSGNEMGTETPKYMVNTTTGEMLWDAPEIVGAYAIAYKITQWRKFGNNWEVIGATEVVMMNIIFDEELKFSIVSPEQQCFSRGDKIGGQFVLNSSDLNPVVAKVSSNLPGAAINGLSFAGKDFIEFEFLNELILNLSVPEGVSLSPFKIYQVSVNLEGNNLMQSSSWGFAIGCTELPGYILKVPFLSGEVKKNFLVYPNPTFDHIVNVRLPHHKDKLSQVRIFNMKGQLMHYQQAYFTEEVISLDLTAFTEGIYVIQVDDNVQKFIIDK